MNCPFRAPIIFFDRRMDRHCMIIHPDNGRRIVIAFILYTVKAIAAYFTYHSALPFPPSILVHVQFHHVYF
jgi:hypothetical protein